jgi:hypothetical protein
MTTDEQIIEQAAAQQLGAAPGQTVPTPEQMQEAEAAAQQAAQDPSAPEGDTPNDMAQTAAAPETEDSQADADPVAYKVMIDGQERVLTPEQIAQTTKRYADLNYKHQTEIAPIKPAVDILNQIMAQAKADGMDLTGDQLAGFLTQTLLDQANTHNPQFGDGSLNDQMAIPGTDSLGRSDTYLEKSAPPNPTDMEAQLAEWEQENAVTLPPMYKNMAAQMGQMQQQNQQLQQGMNELMQQIQGVTQAAQGQVEGASMDAANAQRMTIANNLNTAQQKHGLPDDAGEDFLMFAGERGYGIEDFIDPQLTDMVVQDFASVRSTPEMERLRQINQKRQAFTGITSPGAAGNNAAPAQADPDAEFIDSVTDATLERRNIT